MPYLPPDLPRPQPNLDDRTFWEGCRERRLMFERCTDCGRFRHPPTPICPYCQSSGIAWEQAVGPFVLYTFTEVHHPGHPAVRASVPYAVAVVELPAMDGIRLVSNLVDGAPRIGMRLALVWEEIGEGMWLPRFKPLPE